MEVKNEDNEVVTKFENLAKVGLDHFRELFKEDENVSKEEAVKLAQLYPNLENDEDNKELMKEVSKEEIEKTLEP